MDCATLARPQDLRQLVPFAHGMRELQAGVLDQRPGRERDIATGPPRPLSNRCAPIDGAIRGVPLSLHLANDGSNAILGTPLYLSPEAIISPDSVDAQTDIYALGAVGWFLLAGRPVFDSDNVLAVCSHQLSSIPQRPSERLGKALPSDLEDVLLRCLDKDRNTRPAGARALRDALDACECAGRWTEARAAAWWEQFGAANAGAAGRRSVAPHTLAIDLSVREAVAATVPAARLPVAGAPVV
jgi:hypothetical protein